MHRVVKVMLMDWRLTVLGLHEYLNGSMDGLVLTPINNMIPLIKPLVTGT